MFLGLPGEKGDRGLSGKYHNNTIVLLNITQLF